LSPAFDSIELSAMKTTFQTTPFLTPLPIFLLLVGEYSRGHNGLVVAIIVAALMNIISYFYSRIALALYRTRRVTSGHLTQLYRTVERLTRRAGLHMPKIYLIPNDSPNALATGRNPSHASVAFSQGLLNPPSDEELEGVLERELVLRRTRNPSVQFSGPLECR